MKARKRWKEDLVNYSEDEANNIAGAYEKSHIFTNVCDDELELKLKTLNIYTCLVTATLNEIILKHKNLTKQKRLRFDCRN